MHGTRRHGHHRPDVRREAPGAPMYWGWSPDSGQMELMDLRRYVDAVRAGYDRALEDLYARMSALAPAYGGPLAGMGPLPFTVPVAGPAPGPGRRHGRGHGHGHGCCGDEGGHGRHGHDGCGPGCHEDHRHHGHDHGCGDTHDCRCECCIVDADIVVYARCGEVRVVPIEIENDTRKDREDVELEVSRFRSGGGAELPWKAALTQQGPVTIRGCDTLKVELLVGIVCGRGRAPEPVDPGKDVKPVRGAAKAAATPAANEGGGDDALALAVNVRDRTGGVDSCTVGYVTVRVGGCLVRPIVVAVAVLPDDCGAYEARCSCGDCC